MAHFREKRLIPPKAFRRYDLAMSRLPRIVPPVLFVLVAVSACAADVGVTARFGWGDRFRPERWTPAYVVARADAPVAAVIEWYVPRPGREAMVIRQEVTLNPAGATFPAYLPVGPDPAAVHARVSDAATGRTLGFWPKKPPSPTAYDAAQVRAPVFVGTSGESPSLRFLDEQTYAVAYLPPRDLPRRAVGYDGLDALMLDRPDVVAMDPAQQRAIAAWVRAGGRLVVWPGINPIPADSPLGALLPGRIVDFTTRPVGGKDAPFVRLEGVVDDELVTSVDRGLGRVIFLHAPPDVLHAAGVAFAPADPRPTPAVPELDRARVKAAAPSPARPGWFWPALAVAALIGPVDWLVLRQTRRRGRRWATLPGWVAVFALLALYLPTGTPAAREVVTTVHDDADGRVVSATSRWLGTAGGVGDADSQPLKELDETGVVFEKSLGFDRLTGPTRDLPFAQGDAGMSAEPAAGAVNAEGVAYGQP